MNRVIADNKTEAKRYADQMLTEAKSYTDEVEEYTKASIKQAELESKKYTDNEISNLDKELSRSIQNTSLYTKECYDDVKEHLKLQNTSLITYVNNEIRMCDERVTDRVNTVKTLVDTTKTQLNTSINKVYDNVLKYSNETKNDILKHILLNDIKVREDFAKADGVLDKKIDDTSKLLGGHIDNTSNAIVKFVKDTSKLIWNYVDNTSNDIVSYIDNTSNDIVSYIDNTSDAIVAYIDKQDNA